MLRITVLGEQVITGEPTGEVRSRSSRSLALVARLALHAGTPQDRHLVAGSFWPRSGEAQALTNLRRELHHLRRLLDGSDALEVTGTGLCWRDTADCQVDLRVFRARHAELASAPPGRAPTIAGE
ncbi:MAG: hypothetical protein WB798_02840, partial [Nocardioidaceae bacterium]